MLMSVVKESLEGRAKLTLMIERLSVNINHDSGRRQRRITIRAGN